MSLLLTQCFLAQRRATGTGCCSADELRRGRASVRAMEGVQGAACRARSDVVANKAQLPDRSSPRPVVVRRSAATPKCALPAAPPRPAIPSAHPTHTHATWEMSRARTCTRTHARTSAAAEPHAAAGASLQLLCLHLRQPTGAAARHSARLPRGAPALRCARRVEAASSAREQGGQGSSARHSGAAAPPSRLSSSRQRGAVMAAGRLTRHEVRLCHHIRDFDVAVARSMRVALARVGSVPNTAPHYRRPYAGTALLSPALRRARSSHGASRSS